MRHIEIETNTELTFHFMDEPKHVSITTTDDELYHLLRLREMLTSDEPKQDHLGILKHDLKQVYIALSRAIEEGDQLRIGIVLGQTVSKLDELINQ